MFNRDQLINAFNDLVEISSSRNLDEFQRNFMKLEEFNNRLMENSITEDVENAIKDIERIKEYGENWFSGDIFNIIPEADINNIMKSLFHDSIGDLASFISQELQSHLRK